MVESDPKEDNKKVQVTSVNNIKSIKVSSKSFRNESDNIEVQCKKSNNIKNTLLLDEKKKNINPSNFKNINTNIDKNDNTCKGNNVKNNTGNEKKNFKDLIEHDKIVVNSKNNMNVTENVNHFCKNNVKTEEDKKNYDKDNRNSIEGHETSLVDETELQNSNKFEEGLDDKSKKKLKPDTEIIDGVELIVECASDEEIVEESEEDNISTPKSKTIIIREKPNDSEVDVSSSEAEDFDSYQVIEAKSIINDNFCKYNSGNNTKKRSRKKSALYKVIASESENSTKSNSDDEDYSPVSKKKVKKLSSRKNIKSIEGKRGTGRPRGRPPKIRKIEYELLNAANSQIKKCAQTIVNQTENKKTYTNFTESKNLDVLYELKNENSECETFHNSKNNNENNDTDNTEHGKMRKTIVNFF